MVSLPIAGSEANSLRYLQIFGAGVTICVLLAFARYGWDIHVWDLPFDKMIAGRQVSFAAQALFVPATSLAKVSILISYLRLAPMQSWFRRLTSKSCPGLAVVCLGRLADKETKSRCHMVCRTAQHRLFRSSLHPVHVSLPSPTDRVPQVSFNTY